MMLDMAMVVAQRGTCDRLQVGAVIARESRVVSMGYNGNVSGQPHCAHFAEISPLEAGCESAVHAEANALVFAARKGVAVEGTELFVTHQPCLGCAKLIVNAGITRVYFVDEYRKVEGLKLLLDSSIEVYRPGADYSFFQVTRC